MQLVFKFLMYETAPDLPLLSSFNFLVNLADRP